MDSLFDSNVWLALTFSAHPHHSLAKEVFSAPTEESPACFCRAAQQSFLRLASLPSSSPKVWMDAYLAGFSILHDAEFVTLDRDFRSFEKAGLKLRLLTS